MFLLRPIFSISLLFYPLFLFSHSSLTVSALSDIPIFENSAGVEAFQGSEPWRSGRSLAEQDPAVNSSLILAEDRTRRKDPLDDFKPYTGGWNISNQHYWASVALTSIPFTVIAIAWFVLFGICLFITCLCCCCCRREPYGYSRTAYALSLAFLIFFTISAIVGCVVLYVGQGKFHSRTSSTLEYIVNQADATAENLKNLSVYLSSAKSIRVDSIFLTPDIQKGIDDIGTKISSVSSTLTDAASNNSDKIQNGLDENMFHLRIAVCCIHLQIDPFFVICISVVGDTCVAMEDWLQNPTANTALDDILPCVDNATAKEIQSVTKNVSFQLVSLVNGVINTATNVDPPPNIGPPVNYNQSGPLVPLLCSRFNSDLTSRTCLANEVQLNEAPAVWKDFTCQVSASGICTTTGRLTPSLYNQMTAAANVSYGLYRYGPFLVELVDCTFVRQVFTDISNNHCPGLRLYTKWIYVGLVLMSSAVMFSLIFWIIYARERRHRVYTKQFISRAPGGEDKGN
uniref:Transmembrane protein n=1 Tax=Cucumis melo TaxID=3656 RepID=A0A9I9CJ94_CUCME